MSNHADVAIDALLHHRLPEAMTAALAWWRTNPAPRLAELIIALETLTPEPQRDGLATRLLKVVAGGNSVKSRANVEALRDHPADPRLTDFLLGVVGAPPFDVSSGNPEAFIRAVLELLLRQPDPRVGAWRTDLATFLEAHRGSRSGQLSPDEIATITRLVAELPSPPPPPLRDDPRVEEFAKALEPLQRAKGSAREARERLLGDVIASFDDARAQVYADFLSEQGDPQGELIARMMAGQTQGLEDLLQKARHRCFGSARLEWEKGFPVKAFFANRDGIRSGTWGPELEWGTVRECDVIPLDGCHAEHLETLHVGTTYVKDLARRTQPLPVKTLQLGNLSEGARSMWKKVSALGALERVVISNLSDFDGLLGFLDTPTGQRVTSVEVRSTYSRGRLLGEAAPVFAASRKLETLALPGLTMSRDGTLLVPLASAVDQERLVKDLRDVKRPICERVVLRGPPALTKEPALQSLGARVEVKAESSNLLAKAQATLTDGHLALTPDAGVVFDVSAVQAALEQHQPKSLELTRGVDLRETSALWALATAAGLDHLTLRRAHGDRAAERGISDHWYGAPFALTLTRDGSTWDVGARGGELVTIALSGLPRVKTATLRVAGGLTEKLPELTAALRRHADEVIVAVAEPLAEWTATFVKRPSRLELTARADAAPLRPSTLEALLTQHPKTTEVLVFQRTIDLIPWLDWVSAKKLPLEFRQAKVRPHWPIRLWVEDGLRLSLTLRHELLVSLPPALFSVPAKRLEHLELVHFGAVPPAWVEVAKHLAKTSSTRRPR